MCDLNALGGFKLSTGGRGVLPPGAVLPQATLLLYVSVIYWENLGLRVARAGNVWLR